MATKQIARKASPRKTPAHLQEYLEQSEHIQTQLHKHIMQKASPEVRLAYELLVSLRITNAHLVNGGTPTLGNFAYRRLLIEIGKAQGVLDMREEVIAS